MSCPPQPPMRPVDATDAAVDAEQASGRVRINAGVIFFKSSEWVYQFLDSVYKDTPKVRVGITAEVKRYS